MNHTKWYNDVSFLWALICSIVWIAFSAWVLYKIASYTPNYYILDDQAIERKCVKEETTIYRETYRDENGNVVLVIDRTSK